MKPIKSRIYCPECGRQKILFETEKKALNFIKFNSEEIEEESGRAPIRTYYCEFCGGWHVTSSTHYSESKTSANAFIKAYNQDIQITSIKSEEASLEEQIQKQVDSIIEVLQKLSYDVVQGIYTKEQAMKMTTELWDFFKVYVYKKPNISYKKRKLRQFFKRFGYSVADFSNKKLKNLNNNYKN